MPKAKKNNKSKKHNSVNKGKKTLLKLREMIFGKKTKKNNKKVKKTMKRKSVKKLKNNKQKGGAGYALNLCANKKVGGLPEVERTDQDCMGVHHNLATV